MIKSAYETTLLKNFKQKDLQAKLMNSIVRGEVKELKGLTSPYGKIYAVVEKVDIPAFSYPVLLEDMPGRGDNIFIDLRLHQRSFILKDEQVDIQPGTTGMMLANSAQLMFKWVKGRSQEVMSFSFLPMVLYAQWLSEAVSRKLDLPMDVKLYLDILFAIFYQHRASVASNTFEVERTAVALSRYLRIPAEMVTQIAKRLQPNDLENLDTLLSFIRNDRQNVRLDRLSLKDLYALVMSGWFGGPNAREQVGVALEFPPIFVPMVHQAITNRSYNKLPMSQIYLRHNKSFPLQGFESSYQFLLRGE